MPHVVGPIRFLRLLLVAVSCAVGCGGPVVWSTTPHDADDPVEDFKNYSEHMATSADGTYIYYRVHGSGTAGVLLVVNGGPGLSSHYCEHSVPRLVDSDWQVVTYDQRGTARSGHPSDHSLERYVEDVEAVRAALGVGAVNMFGHSLGAVMTLAYAIDYPDRVEKIILAGGTPPTTAAAVVGVTLGFQRKLGDLRASGLAPPRSRDAVELDDLSFAYGADELAAYVADPLFMTYHMPEDFNSLRRSHYAQYEYLRQLIFASFDLRDGLSTITGPVLMIWGEQDPFNVIDPSTRERAWSGPLAAGLPSAQVEFVPNCGHFWHECMDEYTALIRPFLQD